MVLGEGNGGGQGPTGYSLTEPRKNAWLKKTRKQMWEAEGLREEMVILGGKMPTLTQQIHLITENNKTMTP